MTTTASNKIRIKYNEIRPLYEKLAKGLHAILDEDPRFPSNAVYAVKHRLKGEVRLLEKIKTINSELKANQRPIDHNNLQKRVKDLLGFRVICLRLSDLEKLKLYISSLKKENELCVMSGPTEKKSFLIRPSDEKFSDLQYSGYSSIHYVVRAGKNLRMPKELQSLHVELQLRTIFEEAWGEIDHKYQYEKTRSGATMPGHVTTGFRDLGLYMLACARQADHLCEAIEELAETSRPSPIRRRKRKVDIRRAPVEISATSSRQETKNDLLKILRARVSFTPSDRTLAYSERRLREHSYHSGKAFRPQDLGAALNEDVMRQFGKIYAEVRGKQPFTDPDPSENDLDLVALMNFAIFNTVRPREVAHSGLKAHLLGLETKRSTRTSSFVTAGDTTRPDSEFLSEQKGNTEPAANSRAREVSNPTAREPRDAGGEAR